MKKLRFFGLLVTVLLLAFGMMAACSSDTPQDSTDEVKTTFSGQNADGKLVVFTFSNKAIPAKARAAGPNAGDNYLITVGGDPVSRGYITLPTADVIQFNPDSGEPFQGGLANNSIVVKATVGDTALSVTAAPGSNNTGSGGGGGGGGTGGGGGLGGGTGSGTDGGTVSGGGGGYVVSPTTPLVTYTVVQDGGTSGVDGSTDLEITFDTALPAFRAEYLTITNDTGSAVKTGQITFSNDDKTVTASLDDSESKQGFVYVKINMRGVDPEPHRVAILGKTLVGTNTFAADTIKLLQADGTNEGEFFTTNTTLLEITFGTTTPAAFDLTNIGWNTPLDEYGFKADIEVKNIYDADPSDPAKTFIAAVTVKKQGTVEFFLKGDAFDPSPATSQKATKVEDLRYSVYKVDGTRGVNTTALKFVFEYSPDALENGVVFGDFAFSPATGVEWQADSTLGTPSNNREIIVNHDPAKLLEIRPGILGVRIGTPGVDPAEKTVEVFRAPYITYEVTQLQTLGVTTHLWIVFSEKPSATLVEGSFTAKSGRGTPLLLGAPITASAAAAYNTTTYDTTNPTLAGTRVLLPIITTTGDTTGSLISPFDKGTGSITVVAAPTGGTEHYDIDPRPKAVTFEHNSLVTTATVTKATSPAPAEGALTLNVKFNQPLVTRYDATAALLTAPLVTGFTLMKGSAPVAVLTVGSTAVASLATTGGNLVITSGHTATTTDGSYTLALTSNGDSVPANDLTATGLSFRIEFGQPTTANDTNWIVPTLSGNL